MSIKIALLKSGENIISDAKELVQEDKIRGYLFKEPHLIQWDVPSFLTENEGESAGDLKISLTPWIVLAKDKEIPVSPDWIVALVEPVDQIAELYKEKIEGVVPEGESDGN